MKKKVENKKNYNFLLVLMALVLCIAGVVWYIGNSIGPSDNIQPEATEKLFQSSSTMNFSVVLPIKVIAEDKLDLIYFRIDGEEIVVDINFTNYPDLTGHLSDPRNDLLARTSEIEKLTINGYEAMSGMLDGKKYFFIYVDNAVYFLSTSSPELYDELDAIAQSFQYLGE